MYAPKTVLDLIQILNCNHMHGGEWLLEKRWRCIGPIKETYNWDSCTRSQETYETTSIQGERISLNGKWNAEISKISKPLQNDRHDMYFLYPDTDIIINLLQPQYYRWHGIFSFYFITFKQASIIISLTLPCSTQTHNLSHHPLSSFKSKSIYHHPSTQPFNLPFALLILSSSSAPKTETQYPLMCSIREKQ